MEVSFNEMLLNRTLLACLLDLKYTDSQDNDELVRSFMAVCDHVTENRSFCMARYPPDAALSEAALISVGEG